MDVARLLTKCDFLQHRHYLGLVAGESRYKGFVWQWCEFDVDISLTSISTYINNININIMKLTYGKWEHPSTFQLRFLQANDTNSTPWYEAGVVWRGHTQCETCWNLDWTYLHKDWTCNNWRTLFTKIHQDFTKIHQASGEWRSILSRSS